MLEAASLELTAIGCGGSNICPVEAKPQLDPLFLYLTAAEWCYSVLGESLAEYFDTDSSCVKPALWGEDA